MLSAEDMLEFDLPTVPPTTVAAGDLAMADELDLRFEGWQPEAFGILERLRQHPHIDQYQKEKPGLYDFLKEPFKRYRDDLVVNWVLPSRLDFETERNVFSRLLKNDFGAGGCHHHLWMSFYRPERRRLTDVQISHSLWPDGLEVGLFVGEQAEDLFRSAKERVTGQPERFLKLLNPLLQNGYSFYFSTGSGKSGTRSTFEQPLSSLPDSIERARGIWVRRRYPREDVVEWESDVVRHALDGVREIWPLYRFLA